MSLKQVVVFFCALFISVAVALPEPHQGMVDNAHARDVGVVYGQKNFKGAQKFVFEIKDDPTACQPLNGVSVMSIQICKSDIQCNFYTGTNCEASATNFAVAVPCGDAPDVSTPNGNKFNRYRCGRAGKVGQANQTVKTTPHSSPSDSSAIMDN
ncbi:hypothetical protein EK21DRAFT_108877 [Setomelanomma holmii]|uniref:Uncharacterized protein n=1 Tax=Setomelanomma holmii TaxID=210430 RepID=A0A9P4HFP8_9PLEO|nr:hypothetical protein EK21DRAFT_108877 [Setomelanomma holmii]